MRDLLNKLNTILSENTTSEGYKILPGIDRERYQEKDGLEGPFRANNGRVVYYDPKEGKYYDPDTDFYIYGKEADNLFNRFDETTSNDLQLGDQVKVTGPVDFQDNTGEVVEIGQGGKFVAVDLGNMGIQSFHVSDLSLADDLDFQSISAPRTNTLEQFQIGDQFGISLSEDFEIGTSIVGLAEDGIIITLDESAIAYLTEQGFTFEKGELIESVAGPKSCWKGYKKVGTKPGTGKNAGKRVNDCEKIKEGLAEAEYQGRKVQLNKPMKGDVKKSKVYVKNPKGNVVKVNFGDKDMKIKKSNPERRKSFRARHNCNNPGPKHKARYWSCRAW